MLVTWQEGASVGNMARRGKCWYHGKKEQVLVTWQEGASVGIIIRIRVPCSLYHVYLEELAYCAWLSP